MHFLVLLGVDFMFENLTDAFYKLISEPSSTCKSMSKPSNAVWTRVRYDWKWRSTSSCSVEMSPSSIRTTHGNLSRSPIRYTRDKSEINLCAYGNKKQKSIYLV